MAFAWHATLHVSRLEPLAATIHASTSGMTRATVALADTLVLLD